MKGVSRQQTGPVSYLDREDLNGHVVVQQLSFPHASEAPPGFHLDQLQRFVSHKGGRGWGPGILSRGGEKKQEREDSVILYSFFVAH